MQLIRCYVENFGNLSNVNLNFNNGIQVICRENGWGKSTLAVFICAMFYGLANDKKHGEADNERKHYMPWQGGVFGGNLTFSNEKGTYTIFRTFGKKAREDTFELRDAQTNLVTDLYSEEIGKELFLLDRESFVRTAFLFQDSCETMATSGINAKIHNLAEDTNDMNNYDQVNRQLLSEMNSLGTNRATGTLAKLKEQEENLKEAVRTGPIWERKLKELAEKKDRLEQDLLETGQQQEELLRTQNQQDYMRAEEEARERYAICEKRMAFFHGEVPSDKELEEQNILLRTIEVHRKQREESSFSQDELEEMERLDCRFGDSLPADEELQKQYDNLDRIDELIRKIGKQKAEPGETDSRVKPGDSRNEKIDRATFSFIILCGIVIIFIGAIGIKVLSLQAGETIILLGVAILVWAYWYLKGKGQVQLNLRGRMAVLLKNKRRAEKQSQEESVLNVQEAEDEIAGLKSEIREFLKKYTDGSIPDEQLEEELARLDTEVDRYRELADRCRKFQELTNLLREELTRQNKYLRKYVPARKGADREKTSAEARLRKIARMRNELHYALEEYHRARKKADALKERTEKITGYPIGTQLFSSEELTNRVRKVAELRMKQQEELQTCIYEIEKVGQARDEAAVFAGKLEKLQDEIAEKEHEYEVIRLTQEILTEARNNINAKFMKPIMHAFLQYYEIMSPEQAHTFYIDGDSRITVQGGGKQRDISLLSKGYQDMIGLCLRLALLDAMYPEEKPFLVMDDPLANLDDIRLQGGMEFLRTVSEKYQILYLTCHEEIKYSMAP